MVMWNFKRWGTVEDPIHKSDLNNIMGDYGCLKSFKLSKDAIADGAARENKDHCNGKAVAGTAGHETIDRALQKLEVQKHLLGGGSVSRESVSKTYLEEWHRCVNGREVIWYGKNPDTILEERIDMVHGLLNDLHNHVSEVLLSEGGFVVKCGELWLCGHVDFLGRPKDDPTGILMGDWKTGAQKPDPIELDHGWESGIYSLAVARGVWVTRDQVTVDPTRLDRYEAEREAVEAELIAIARRIEAGEDIAPTFGEFPSAMYHVHLGDYVPYKKASTKTIKRPEDLKFYGATTETSIKTQKGDRRGPAWLPIKRRESDIPRLEHRLKGAARIVRMGIFVDNGLGEKCNRCEHRTVCLNDGYAVAGDEKKQLEQNLRGMDAENDFDGFTKVA